MIFNYWTDGAATMRKDENGNYIRETGGWAFALIDENNKEIQFSTSGGELQTTNQRMELEAIRRSLNHYMIHYITEKCSDTINIYSDSAYCINIFTQWIKGWVAKGWRRGKNQPIENLDLIQDIWATIRGIEDNTFSTVNFIKVKGHSGEKDWNDYVNKLAVETKLKIRSQE